MKERNQTQRVGELIPEETELIEETRESQEHSTFKRTDGSEKIIYQNPWKLKI